MIPKPLIPLLAATLLITGCSNLAYYSQSIGGQLELMNKRRPITEVTADKSISDATRGKLQEVLKIRDFATRELALPDNDSYRLYANLERPYAVWNVFAAPEFSLQPKQWCFLIVGCLAYRGYFAEEDAQRFGAELRKEGLDVVVSGVRAYSTLGWFDDPILNTFLDLPRYRLAGLMFHELAHQQLYIDDDSMFNESFATAVQQEGVRRYLQQHGSDAERAEHERSTARQVKFLALVTAARERLRELYGRSVTPERMRAEKRGVLEKLRADYAALRERWGGYRGYDAWFARDLNNARLAAVATYQQYVPAFERLLEEQSGKFDMFYRAAREVGALPPAERRAYLEALINPAAKGPAGQSAAN